MTPELGEFHRIVLWWISVHPGHRPAEIATGLQARENEIAGLCADLAAAAMVEQIRKASVVPAGLVVRGHTTRCVPSGGLRDADP